MEFTKERLEEIAEDGFLKHGESKALARIALASLEAEAVEWRVAFRLDGQSGSDFEKTFEDQAKMNEIISLHERAGFSASITPLYTAPPVPVSVPDELTREEYKRRFMEDDDFDDTFRGGWKAHRAAMLQGAEQTNYRTIVERIAEIVHGKITDIDLLTVTVKSMKDKLHK